MLSKFRRYFAKVVDPIAKYIAKAGVSPNILTVLGVVSSAIYLVFAWYNALVYAFIMVILAGFFDVIDGAVARVLGKVSKVGEFLDSTLDRLSDAMLIAGLLFTGINGFLVISLLIFSFLVSYVRAKGELLGLKMEGIGLVERAERIIFISVIIITCMVNLLIANVIALILLILTLITLIDRVFFVLKSLI